MTMAVILAAMDKSASDILIGAATYQGDWTTLQGQSFN
jgi:hypothetical protein